MASSRRVRRVAIVVLAVVVVALVSVKVVRVAGRTSADVAALLAPVRSYDPAGPYVNPVNDHTNIDPPKVILGSDGIPRIRYDKIGYHNNPVLAAQYGLWAYGAYLRNRNAEHRRIALRVADWLIRRQTKDRWLYDFDFSFNGVAMAKPWV